ncbi:MAG: cell division protein FtsZ [Rhodobacteraceae bacterium]|nr:cell division protein FtsZ [Paracoccaceae bacterium]MCY4197600.1 cell division protein FtsZ [Paracoccaceae bacterium]MCY4327619.1 cell division protein FtsZ [Paracoccaceae bacterium]
MALESITVLEHAKLVPLITVFGVGGAGCNAVQTMKDKNLHGVQFVIANTDAQSLANSSVTKKIQLGPKVTKGLGAGADPEIGRQSAEESAEEIRESLEGTHMLFITAGMGGGTGTGAVPVIAKIARQMDILTIGVVTKPFMFEGSYRANIADAGVVDLRKSVHTSVVIANQNLFLSSNETTPSDDAFMKADDVLYEGVKNITDLMVKPGRINLDFADVRTVMLELGSTLMGTGEDSGDNRAKVAAKRAMTNQLLEDTRLDRAKAVLINITGGEDQTLFDLNDASEEIRQHVSPDARIIIGSTVDPAYKGKIKVSLLAAGVSSAEFSHDLEPHFTELPDAETIWENESETSIGIDDEDFYDDNPADDGFQPSSDWPHVPDEKEISAGPGADATDSPDASVEAEPEESEPRPPLQFVVPKVGGTSRGAFPPVMTPENTTAETREPPDHEARPIQKNGRLRSLFGRMNSSTSDAVPRILDDSPRLTTLSRHEAGQERDAEDIEAERKERERDVPAYIRRQAN